jgi:hypothetical protein
MFLVVQIGNSSFAFHLIHNILDVINNFPSTLQDSTIGKSTLFIVEVPLNLLVPLISIPPLCPSWNHHVNNYVYEIFGFANKYMEKNGAILIFHDDNPHILKEIKLFLNTNGYEI